MKYLSSWKLLIVCLAISMTFVTNAFAEQASGDKSNKNFVELSATDIKPPFTQTTVLKLNAIVRRSYDAINEFDRILEDTRASISAVASKPANAKASVQKAQEHIKKMHSLDLASTTALTDINAAAKTLRNGNEEYNRAILEGMIQFVEEVQKEITTERKSLEKALQSA